MLKHKFRSKTQSSDDYNEFKLQQVYDMLDNDIYYKTLREKVSVLEGVSEQTLEEMENLVIQKQLPGRSPEWMLNHLKVMYERYFNDK
jgi:hypothetical protein